MYLLIIDYTKPTTAVAPHKEAYQQWVKQQLANDHICAAGPMKNQSGGVIFAKSMDESVIKKLIASDPYTIADVANYRIIDFNCKATSNSLSQLQAL